MKNNCKRLINKSLGQKKQLKEKVINFISWIYKKDFVYYYHIKMCQYFLKPYKPFVGDINVKADLSNFATKTAIKNFSHVHTSSFALMKNLVKLKTEVNKLDIDELVLLLKRQIIMLKSLKQKVKFPMLVIQQQKLH